MELVVVRGKQNLTEVLMLIYKKKELCGVLSEAWFSSVILGEGRARRAAFIGKWREQVAIELDAQELRIVKILVIWDSRVLNVENLTIRKSSNKGCGALEE